MKFITNLIAISFFLIINSALAEVDGSTVSKTNLRQQVGVRAPVQYATSDNVRLAYSDPDARSGLPIVIALHAIGHGGRDFEAFQHSFAGKYRIITLDWPGQGYSSSDQEPASVSRYTKLLANFVEQKGLSNFVILGNSIGGGVAIQYASENPKNVKALILSNPAGLDEGGFFAKIFTWWMEKNMHLGTTMNESFHEWFTDYYHKVLITEESAQERDRIIAASYEIAPILEQAWRSFRQPEGDLRSLIHRIQAPVLFAWAQKDEFVQWSRCKKAVHQFSNKKVVFFEAGHSPFLETPEEFNNEAENFLTGLKFSP